MILKTKRLILREWNKKDIQDIIEGVNNWNVVKWVVKVPYPYTKKDALDFIKGCKKKRKDGYKFAIELKSEKKAIGGITIRDIDNYNGTASGGIWLNQKYHGKGYGTEAWNCLLDFAFNKLKLRKMENGFIKGNKASGAMQNKLGYKIEGLRRKGFKRKADGKIVDEVITGLLKEDWEKAVKTKQKK